MNSLFLCRRWLAVMAEECNAQVGLQDRALAERAARESLHILTLAPWHLRILVGGVEIFASFWCVLDRALHGGRVDGARELSGFSKIPLISPPLLRLYRSLVTVNWIDQPQVAAALGRETPEARQARFRDIRQAAL